VYWFVKDPAKLSCPNKPPPQPYAEATASGRLQMMATATSMADALTAAPKKGDGKTNELSSPDGKGPPLTFLEMLSRNLQYAGALASGDTSGDPKDPNGSRYGKLGGKNVGGPNSLIVQAAAGTFAVIGIPFKSGKDFLIRITKALKRGKAPAIVDPKVLSKEIAEELAKGQTEDQFNKAMKGEFVESYGMAMAISLRDAGVIMPYSRAQIFTKGWEAKFQAHHVYEVKWMKIFDKEAIGDAPAVILSKAEHDAVTKRLRTAKDALMDEVKEKGGKNAMPTKAEVWAMYQEVYKDQPNWLKAIEGYFQ
jgi:hypothetical protein